MTSDTGKRHFHDQLDLLQNRLMEMAGRAEELVRISSDALVARDDLDLADVRARDQAVDEIEIEIDERVVELLALQQPMAGDLRQIFTTLRISNDLERVGDHAVNMAFCAARIAAYPALPEIPEVEEMSLITQSMLSDALAAYASRDGATARDVHRRDDRVDSLRRSLHRILVSHMLEVPRRIGPCLELLLVGQNLERIADLATNISEEVVFLVEGRTIKRPATRKRSVPGRNRRGS